MLNEKQIAELNKPFEFKEHGFYLKNPYILKSAIRARLNRVVPGWILLPPELIAHDENVIVMRGGIQIGEVKRYAVGTGIIISANSDGEKFDGAKLAAMISKAYKQAVSDILPRAAVEFGVGEYLKNKPKGINEDNFAGWFAKLTADPNAWTPDNILIWGDKWRAKGLTNPQLMKALNISGKWSDFKGTVSDADKAAEAFIEIGQFDPPAKPKLSPIMCPINLLEAGDVVLMEHKTDRGPQSTRYQIVENWGKIGSRYKLEVINLNTGMPETLNWAGGNEKLVDGPKCAAYAKDPSLCIKPPVGVTPLWDRQFATSMVG